jgi:glucose-1-phosphate cytidylyltransferase
MKKISNFPVVILAGGLGTRMRGVKDQIPKPMIKILGVPIIKRIMNHYSKFGLDKFIICAGYKQKQIVNYFKKKAHKWDVKVINTGLKTMTGGRLKKIEKFINVNFFFLTYGDGLSNINISDLFRFHIKNKKIATCLAVNPPARFGALNIKKHLVKHFSEKPFLNRNKEGWINGGFFVLTKEVFKYIKNDKTIFEREPLNKLVKNKQLSAYKYNGFWQCMDTPRDKEMIELYIKKKILS